MSYKLYLKAALQVILGMAGKMPESTRYALMMNILQELSNIMLNSDGYGALADFQASGVPHQFMVDCDIKSGPGHVCSTVSANDSDLAQVINRWSNMQGLTNDQVDTRDAMLGDLKAIMVSDYDSEGGEV